MCECLDALVGVVHAHANSAFAFVFVHVHFCLLSVLSFEKDREGTRLVYLEIRRLVLVPKGMPTNNNGLFPARDQPGDVLYNDRLTEDSSIQNVTDCTIGTLPHGF